MILGLDAATILTPYAQRIADANIKAVGRYLKSLTRAEIAALHAAGIAVWLIFEAGAENALGGAAQGTADGQLARLQAFQGLGAPQDRTVAIYGTVDTSFDSNGDPEKLEAVVDYFSPFSAALDESGFRTGSYADGRILDELRSHGLELEWMAGAFGWEGSRAYLAQRKPTLCQGPTITDATSWAPPGMDAVAWPDLGFPYDPNFIFEDDFGAWKA